MGPSNAGLVDPAQCALIALANVTVELLRYAVVELMTEDEVTADQCLALVRQQTVLELMDRAIQEFAEILDRQDSEEQAIQALIDTAASLLGEFPGLTGEELSDRLEVDTDELEEVLRAALARGRLRAENRYFAAP